MARKRKGNAVNGWINLDKPQGLTSTQAMAKVRRLLGAGKAGHAGTLDPLATGVLPVALGEATKTIPFVQNALKAYDFTIAWGVQTDTDDSEGQSIATSDVRPGADAVKAGLNKYIGEILQTPPRFSAIKIDGQRAYDLARAGEAVEIKPRSVYIESIEIIECFKEGISSSRRKPGSSCPGSEMADKYPDFRQDDGKGANSEPNVSLRMVCGPGTYVRSLARDLAIDLGTCGHISALRRIWSGPFRAENAISLDILEGMDEGARLERALLPLQAALDDIPALDLRDSEAAGLRHGKILNFVSRPDVERLHQAGLAPGPGLREAVALFNGQPVALVEVEGVEIRPVRVLNL